VRLWLTRHRGARHVSTLSRSPTSRFEKGECVLFIGAGIGIHYKDGQGEPLPNVQGLADELVEHFDELKIPKGDLPRVAQLVELRSTRGELDAFIKKRFANVQPDAHIQWLTTFRWRSIYTTNYDMGLEKAYEINGHPPQNPVPISITANMRYTDTQVDVPIFHLHGTPYNPCPSAIVVTELDYTHYKEHRQMVWNRLKNDSAVSTILYVGYSGRDPNWKLIIEEMAQDFKPSKPPISFKVDPYADEIDIEVDKEVRRIETLVISLADFHALVEKEIGDYRPAPDTLNKLRNSVPQHLREHYDKAPAPMLRLLDSWSYVNGEDMSSAPNVEEFLNGFSANWQLVAQNRRFIRDVEAELLDHVLEFSAGANPRSTVFALLGPAGYGITTISMAIAVKIVQEKWGTVFALRQGKDLKEGDISYASSLFPDFPCYFIIDQAKEQAPRIQNALAQQRSVQRNSLFIIAERRNEWLSANPGFHTEDFDVEPLSDAEINRLLDFLTQEDALGDLGPLDRPYQFDIVKKKHEQQLLVAMREATAGDGVGFDTIIETEFRGVDEGVNDSVARELYLLVCCFYQHGILIRDQLIGDILNSELSDLYQKLGTSLDGMIEYVETSKDRGLFALRARHRTIAEIVWKKCGSQVRKEHLLQRSMEKMNLIYDLDRTVFDLFVMSDEIVATFSTFKGKVTFFETAARRAPNNVFVLQHFARMLLHEGQLKLALNQIDEAIGKSKPRVIRPLHHTRGMIMEELAMTEENIELARKYLAHSEREFRICIGEKEADDYGHTGLAELLLRWAKRNGISTAEGSEYLEKSEKVIAEGLKVVSDKSRLLIVSAKIQKELGNRPEWLSKLRQAVESSTGNEISRYLLGRAYREENKPDMAMQVLEPVIRNDFGNVRAYIEYTRAMLDAGESLNKCIATLAQCRLDGEFDAAYIGLFGGLLFLDNRFADAKKLWDDAKERNFSYLERKKKQFLPHDPADRSKPLRLSGSIQVIKQGWVLLQPESGPMVIATMTWVGGSPLKGGDKVDFDITFSAKGAFAENLRRTGESNPKPESPPSDQLSLSLE
jgi:tetratricopeptide (TPR) repeat protein